MYLDELFSLDGLSAVVTGGSSGIGRAIAGGLTRAGAHVTVIARSEGALRETVADGDAAGYVRADLGDRDDVRRAAGECGEPDILVNSAGINLRPPLGDLTDADWDATMAVNLTAPFLLGQAFGPAMAARGFGRIINISSQQAFVAFSNSGAYGASKAGVTGLTRSQAEAWAPNVCCNALVPGFVRTPLTTHISPEKDATMAARTLIGRNGQPNDFTGTAILLAGHAAAYITGQAIFIDGGFSTH